MTCLFEIKTHRMVDQVAPLDLKARAPAQVMIPIVANRAHPVVVGAGRQVDLMVCNLSTAFQFKYNKFHLLLNLLAFCLQTNLNIAHTHI